MLHTHQLACFYLGIYLVSLENLLLQTLPGIYSPQICFLSIDSQFLAIKTRTD